MYECIISVILAKLKDFLEKTQGNAFLFFIWIYLKQLKTVWQVFDCHQVAKVYALHNHNYQTCLWFCYNQKLPPHLERCLLFQFACDPSYSWKWIRMSSREYGSCLLKHAKMKNISLYDLTSESFAMCACVCFCVEHECSHYSYW